MAICFNKVALAALLVVVGSSTSACKKDDLECLPQDLTTASQRERVVHRTLLLQRKNGDWKPVRIVKSIRWADKARHLSSTGTVELFDGTSPDPFAVGPADGPAFFEASLFRSVPEPQGDAAIEAARDQVLEGAIIPLVLPAFPESSALAARVPTRVRWISALHPAGAAVRTADEQLREVLLSEGFLEAGQGEYHFDLSSVPEEAVEADSRTAEKHRSPEGVHSPYPFEVVHWSGDPRFRLNLVLLPDGYSEAELPQYRAKVAEIVEDLLEYQEPYRTYRDLINVIRVDTLSPEIGVSCDDGEYSIRDNRYGSSFPVACLNALIGTSFNDRFTYQLKADRVILDSYAVYHQGVSIADEVYVVSRSDKYGGAAIAWSTQTDGSQTVTASHEMGHSWGRLADEYLVDGDICHIYMMFSANVSVRKKKPKHVKWKHWLNEDLPFPTPNDPAYAGKGVGFFQGAAGGCRKALYRPQFTCKMDNSHEAFCPPCMEQMIHRIFDRASLVEGGLRRDGDSVTASVFSPERLYTRWYVDGRLAKEMSGFAPLTGLDSGRHEVRLEVIDTEAPVKKNRCDLVTRVEAEL